MSLKIIYKVEERKQKIVYRRDEEEFEQFQRLMNGKIEAFLEIAINEVKEHYSTDERLYMLKIYICY